jgi:Ubiquitin-Binding Zinc Finger
LGINVGKFTEEPKIVNSIAKFFQKSVSKEVVPALTAEKDHKETHAAAIPEKSETGQSSKISSFFVNHSKIKALAKSPAKNETPTNKDYSKQQDSPKKKVFEEYDSSIALTNEAGSDEETSRDFADKFNEPSQDVNTEAPCPQCGSLVSIIGMSEHLDHHVATDLHKELNQAAPTAAVSTSQSTSSSMGGVAGKRKYTKKTESQSGAKKTRSIQSFFTQK